MAHYNIKICSYNCCSLVKNIDVIRELSALHYDLIFLQETMLLDNKLGMLDFIDENYESVGVAATLSDRALAALAGRPQGGMAILFKKSLHLKINEIILQSNFMVFNIAVNGIDLLLVNVYLNSDVWEAVTLQKYLQTLSELSLVIEEIKFDSIYFIGDFNADPHTGRAWQSLSSFMAEHVLTCLDVDMLDSNTFTFMAYGNSCRRWLDHVIGRDHAQVTVQNMEVLSSKIGSDHFPLSFNLLINKLDNTAIEPEGRGTSHENDRNDGEHINWNKLTDGNIRDIASKTDIILGNMYDPTLSLCTKVGCRNMNHTQLIDKQYKSLCSALSVSSRDYVSNMVKLNKFKVIPGWNRRVKGLHMKARECYLNWVSSGMVIDSEEHTQMTTSRRDFKTALKNCKANENTEICNSIVEKFGNRNKREFWTDVKRRKGNNKKTNIIDGKVDKKEIMNLFSDRYLFNQPSQDLQDKSDFMTCFKPLWDHGEKMYPNISSVTLNTLINKLNDGVGHDGIHSHFLKHASHQFLRNLALLYNVCLHHCYLPLELLKGNITPVVKNTKGNITEASNYRPVMQSSCLLKIWEMIILNILEEKIDLDDRQFGFREGISTTDACFLVKEVMHDNVKKIKRGVLTFVDLSKAFDLVNHFILGKKLIEKNIPSDLILLIMHYLRNQKANVKWQGEQGGYHYIEHGVRQGGVLSPFLFKFYINSVLTSVNSSDIGCTVGLSKLNIMAYADDIVLLANSISDMEHIYEIFCDNIDKLKLKINMNKTKCMLYGSKHKRQESNFIQLGPHRLEIVKSYDYLGHIVSNDLRDKLDVEKRINSFYGSFHGIYRSFSALDNNTFMYLFNAYCKPDYGLPLWNGKNTINSTSFSAFEIAYAKSLKKILNVPNYASNHETAEKCNQLLLKHHVALTQARYYKRISRSKSSILKLNLPTLRSGLFFSSVHNMFTNVYNVDLDNLPFDILQSRIIWVQRHEERRVPYRVH